MIKKNKNIIYGDIDISEADLRKKKPRLRSIYLGTYVGPKIYETISEITEKTNKKYSEVVKDSLESYANNYILFSKKTKRPSKTK